MKKVSIIVPVYNSEKTLDACVNSVLTQDYEDIQLIIVDDGSTDNSLVLANRYKSEKVKVLSQRNSGACKARNFGLSESNGFYVKFLDSDDILLPGAIKEQVEVAESLSNDSLIPYGYSSVVTKKVSRFKKVQLELEGQEVYLVNTNLTISLPLHRRNVLDAFGGFDEKLSFRQEWDLHLRLVNKGFRFFYHEFCVFQQNVLDSQDRISNRRLNFESEVSNLEYIRGKFSFCQDSLLASAWSYKYWTLGRQFLKQQRVDEAIKLFDASRKISPDGYEVFFPKAYWLVFKLLGARRAEKILRSYKAILNIIS